MIPDLQTRIAAFTWLDDQVRIHGDVLPRTLLAQGFVRDGERVPLLGPQGIFKPKVLAQIPLSITTAPKGPYDDRIGRGGLLEYRYRGTSPEHPDNVGLRKAMSQQMPLVYFHGIVPGRYLAIYPVFVVGDNPRGLTFTVAADDVSALVGLESGGPDWPTSDSADCALSASEQRATVEGRRAYVTATVRRRLHQRRFSERVLRAYREHCALCKLRHRELLDAAHIIEDSQGGEPIVPNGLALCKLHHAAFDGNIIGIRPDYIIEVREDVLKEKDGPMLQHGLQKLKGQRLCFYPRSVELRPNPEFLEQRHERFLAQSSG